VPDPDVVDGDQQGCDGTQALNFRLNSRFLGGLRLD
jgi:hypothetical protein